MQEWARRGGRVAGRGWTRRWAVAMVMAVMAASLVLMTPTPVSSEPFPPAPMPSRLTPTIQPVGTFAPGESVSISVTPPVPACSNANAVECFYQVAIAPSQQCVFVNHSNPEGSPDGVCQWGGLFEYPRGSWRGHVPPYFGGDCREARFDYQFLHGGPSGTDWEWPGAGNRALDCTLTIGDHVPRPDALMGATWIYINAGFRICEVVVDGTCTQARDEGAFGLVPLEGDGNPLYLGPDPVCRVEQSGPGGRDVVFIGGVNNAYGGYDYEWIDPNGFTVPATAITYTADRHGLYTATYRTWTNDGRVDRSATCTAHVEPFDARPNAQFSYEASPDDPGRIVFTNQTTHPDSRPMTYEWTFEQGATSTATNPTHTFPLAGTYPVTLRAVDDIGEWDLVTVEVLVESNGLVVNSTGDGPAQDPEQGCTTGGTVGDDEPECTLRAAIEVLNHREGGVITFDIDSGGVPSIATGSNLPAVTAADGEIDGTTQDGGWVKVTGGDRSDGFLLTLGGSGQRVSGLVLDEAGGALEVTGDDVTVEGNVVGADPAGATAGEVGDGIVLRGANAVVRENVVSAATGMTVLGADAVIEENLIGVSRAGAASGASQVGVIVVAPNATVADNTVRATVIGIAVVTGDEGSAAGASVTGNRVGVNASGTVFADQGEGIRVGGASDVTVTGNRIAAGDVSGVSVAGIAQVYESENDEGKPITIFLNIDSSSRVERPVTGRRVTVSGNVIGGRALSASNSGDGPARGVVVWEGAEEVTISANTVAGQSGEAIHLAGGPGHVVVGNTVGYDIGGAEVPAATGIRAQGTAGVELGRVGAGNKVLATDTGIRLEKLEDADGSGTIAGNTVTSSGDAEESGGITVAEETLAATVTANTVTGFALGIGLQSTSAEVADNTVAGSGAGIFVDPDGATITGNVVTGTETTAIAAGGDDATVEENVVGRTTASGPNIGNAGDGIHIGGTDATVRRNVVAASGGVGIGVSDTGSAELRGNRILASGGMPIRALNAPAPPEVTGAFRTTFRDADRTVLVMRDLPEDAGVIEVFANDSCDDGEAEKVLEVVKGKEAGATFRVVLLEDRPLDDHFTVTFTSDGKTSGLSDCTSTSPFVDSDGDGSHDALDDLIGAAGDPTTAVVLTDREQVLALSLASFDAETGIGGGRITGAGGVDGPREQPPGVSLPYGLIGFTIEGLVPGGTTELSLMVLDGDPLSPGHSYWKYGSPTSVDEPTWYEFDYDEASRTGARRGDPIDVPGVGLQRPFILTFTDGARGDSDGGANGSIRDPGGPAIVVSSDEPDVPDDSPGTVETDDPTDPSDSSDSESSGVGGATTDAEEQRATAASDDAPGVLPRTGSEPRDLVVAAMAMVLMGMALLRTRSRARVRMR